MTIPPESLNPGTNCLEALTLTCATNKIVQCPTNWNFDDPIVSDPCCGTNYILTFTTVTNGTSCSNVFTRIWQVIDCLNRTATCSQTVTVVNTNLPVIQCPPNMVLTSCVPTQVFYTVTASNACCTNVAVLCNPPSGSLFEPGTTTWVNCTATDCCTNTTNCRFTVTVVRDTNCCLTLTNELVICNYDGTYTYTFGIRNDTDWDVGWVSLTEVNGNPVFQDPFLQLIPALPPHQTRQGLTETIAGAPCGPLCFYILLYPPTFTNCCDQVHCVTLPNCCLHPPPGMTAWWPFDETNGPIANDIAGSFNNQGTHFGWWHAIAGMVSNAVCFGVTNEFFLVTNQLEINFVGSCTNGTNVDSFTIDAWIRADSNGPNFQTLLDKRDNPDTAPRGYSLFLNYGRLGFQTADGTTWFNTVCTNLDLRDSQWHFITITGARCGPNGNVVTLYVDGVERFSDADSLTGDLNNSADLLIAHTGSGVHSYSGYSGCLDELEFFKRVLTVQEIQDIFNAGPAGKCKTNCTGALTLTCATNKIVQCPTNWNPN
jgi:hypothetical protein